MNEDVLKNLTDDEREIAAQAVLAKREESAAIRRFNDLAEKPTSQWTREDCEFVRTNPVCRRALRSVGWDI